MLKFFFIAAVLFVFVRSDNSCYPNLGCFPNTKPWSSYLRPLPKPWSPEKINTTIYFYNRANRNGKIVKIWPNIQVNRDYNPLKPTVVFTHGYLTGIQFPWITDLKNALLDKMDVNVYFADWQDGSMILSYNQVSSNARIVGAELARFGNYLVSKRGANPKKMHLIGHSVGAHVMAYMANGIKNIGRITGLDPARPLFEAHNKIVKLEESDAAFVDIIHSTSDFLFTFSRLGYAKPAGHVDFFINHGGWQPDCSNVRFDVIAQPKYLFLRFVVNFSYPYLCAHHRAITIFKNSMFRRCEFKGEPEIRHGQTSIIRRLRENLLMTRGIEKVDCSRNDCVPLGMDLPQSSRGSYNVPTTLVAPYCQ